MFHHADLLKEPLPVARRRISGLPAASRRLSMDEERAQGHHHVALRVLDEVRHDQRHEIPALAGIAVLAGASKRIYYCKNQTLEVYEVDASGAPRR